MLPKNKVAVILKSKSGVSLIFVLGIMLMLFAMGGAVISGTNARIDIGSSVMGAATANFGSNIRQEQYNKAVVLGESIHRSLKQSLLNDNADSLGRKLPRAIFDIYEFYPTDAITGDDARIAAFRSGFPLTLVGDPKVVAALAGATYQITVSFPFPNVNPSLAYHAPIPAMPELDIIRIPARATLNAKIVVEVEVSLQGGADSRSVSTFATYEYRGGELSDYNGGANNNVTDPDFIGALEFEAGGFGTWELVSYEIIES